MISLFSISVSSRTSPTHTQTVIAGPNDILVMRGDHVRTAYFVYQGQVRCTPDAVDDDEDLNEGGDSDYEDDNGSGDGSGSESGHGGSVGSGDSGHGGSGSGYGIGGRNGRRALLDGAEVTLAPALGPGDSFCTYALLRYDCQIQMKADS